MKTSIYWNCRGLGNPSTVNSLYDLVRKYSPDLLFLSETKSSFSDIKKIQCKLMFDHCNCVEAIGKGGGLALFWNNNISLTVSAKNSHVIDSIIKDRSGSSWRWSRVYGWAERNLKFKTWEMISKLGSNNYLR